MAIPDRPKKGGAGKEYYYHVYDYEGSKDFEAAKKTSNGNYVVRNEVSTTKFRYSLVKDMEGLAQNRGDKKLDVECASFTHSTNSEDEIHYLKFGNNPDVQILLTGGVHAREWIAVEIPYLIAEYLIKNYDSAAEKGLAKDIKDLLEKCQICVIPMLNPDGHRYSVTSEDETIWRKNRSVWKQQKLIDNGILNVELHSIKYLHKSKGASTYKSLKGHPIRKVAKKWFSVKLKEKIKKDPGRKDPKILYMGVDCNRNFAEGDHPIYIPSSENFCGLPESFKEPETQAINTFVTGLQNLVASIDYHSARGAIIYPEDSKEDDVVKTVGEYMKAHVVAYDAKGAYECDKLTKIMGNKAETSPSVMGCCHKKMGNRKLAFTIELDPIYDDYKVSNEKKLNRWFSIAPADIQRIFEKNLIAVLCLIHNAVDPDWQPVGQRQRSPSATSRVSQAKKCCPFKTWESEIRNKGNMLPTQES